VLIVQANDSGKNQQIVIIFPAIMSGEVTSGSRIPRQEKERKSNPGITE
jgi:hypothetical protein